MKILEKIKAEVAENPKIYAAELSKKLGVSRQYIYQVCRKNKIKLANGACGPRDGVERFRSIHHYGIQLSSHFVGGASELTACSDLLRKGIPVYRALTFVSAADLIINVDENLLRVEVRSARRNTLNQLTYSAPPAHRYDVLALVEPDGRVTYKPDLFPIQE